MGGDREVRGVRRDGTEFPVEVGLNPVELPDGAFVLASVIDISDRRRAEAALRVSEERYRLATAAAAVGVWEWNTLTDEVYWNEQMFQLYQIPPTPDGLVGYETWSRAVVPEDLPRQEEILRDTVARRGSSTRSFRIRLPDGSCRYVDAAERVHLAADGRVEWVVGTNIDVTGRTEAELALQESEALLGSFFEAPGALRGVVELTHDDIIHLRDNATTAAFFGRSRTTCGAAGRPRWGSPPGRSVSGWGTTTRAPGSAARSSSSSRSRGPGSG